MSYSKPRIERVKLLGLMKPTLSAYCEKYPDADECLD